MILLSDAVNFKKLDSRLVERNIARGVLTEADFKLALSELPDDAENAEWIAIDSFTQDQDLEGNSDLPHDSQGHEG